MKAKFAKLIDVKSIMTLMMTVVFCVLALLGVITGQEFITIFTVIVGFYFGTQSQKKADEVKPTTNYTGQSQSMEEVSRPIAETVDAATVQAIHPPDAEKSESDIVVTGFAG